MRSEFEANLTLQPMDNKTQQQEIVGHYQPGGEWTVLKWCAGVVAAGALLGVAARIITPYL